MSYKIEKLSLENFPPQLLEIPQPPKSLYIVGKLPPEDSIYLAVIGSRKYTSYGKEACERLIDGLRGYPIVIVSGLALGIDAIAHKAALRAGLTTLAFPGSGLDARVLYPRSNFPLAEEILRQGGALISEFEPDFRATEWSFPRRNRIVAGMCRAVLVVEAPEKSGARITARLATEYNRDVLAVPGSIFSESSKGTNILIRQGATPITKSEDILEALGFEIKEQGEKSKDVYKDCSAEELAVLKLLNEPCARDILIRALQKPTHETNTLLSIMEIKGLIKEELGGIRKC